MLFIGKPIALAVAMALPSTGMFGTDVLAADDKATTLPEVTVSATKADDAAPVGGTILDSASLATRRAAASDTATLIGDLPGVSLYGAGGVSSLPVIHGLADDRLRIKVRLRQPHEPAAFLHRPLQCRQHPGI